MSFPPRHSSPPKRPKLSLQIKTPSAPQTIGKSSTALKSDINPSSPTALNTLSNAYATAIDNSSPQISKPMTSAARPSLRIQPMPSRLQTTPLQTNISAEDGYIHPSERTATPGPFAISYPDTPSSARPKDSPTFTFTPPHSAGGSNKMYAFSSQVSNSASPRSMRRHTPYTHPKSLHSILRNSPLPPPSSVVPATPNTASRIAMKLANRGTKRVEYDDPLTQTITTNKYVKSHIDLLSEDSPHSATDPEFAILDTLDTTMKYTGDETRDGGQTPGPFEEMRRRMAESGLETPASRKRKRKDKKRKWRWTIGDGEDSDAQTTPTTAMERTPITSIWRGTETINTDSIVNGNGDGMETISTGGNNVPSDEAIDSERICLGNYEGGEGGIDDRDRRGQSVDFFTDSEMSEEGSERPGTSHSL
ncbi:hypothetical protein SS1G_14357 [Sclerotinia sclerotiorum 1980 UF-70]|uniref:Uncharacterized protein n=2 Tax=Sclerotinia sclerotiorum (strain ATCC 18683 / 1980 / Ss-1) TaxID=665079 RepID=A0A1D9QN95_SCLS1|nr:hypothetical protein SS1G_14357 [Sclerotinia sclerotiorum 1980 UF-70]APA16312.1 hypothetical protein sscle_16g110820 [Sclerotinia sclerotiorum 1980 UF-70]EDO00487.1 hypothetical protein SS1G_14357 [Sclerotinia sclerotiorum 1980 UF-70]